jgi:hypothetical protein
MMAWPCSDPPAAISHMHLMLTNTKRYSSVGAPIAKANSPVSCPRTLVLPPSNILEIPDGQTLSRTWFGSATKLGR